MIPEYTLNAEDVRGMMLGRMEKHLSLKDSCGIVSSSRLREQLNAALVADDLREQEAEMNTGTRPENSA